MGAGVVAFWDGAHAAEEFKKGNIGLGFAYTASAALGLGGAVLILFSFASATGIGLILVGLAICISILIEFIKDNPLQEWLEGSFFGKNTFANLTAEMQGLREVAQ